MKFAIFLLLSLNIIFSLGASADTKVFKLINNEGKNCTATFFKKQQECHLITNAHCIANPESKVIVSGESLTSINRKSHSLNFITRSTKQEREARINFESSFFQSLSEQNLQVKKIDRSKDLAEIQLPTELVQLCQTMEETKIKERVSKRIEIALVGYTNLKNENDPTPRLWYTDDTVINESNQIEVYKTEYKIIPATLSNLDSFIEIPKLPMTWGQSGGAGVNSNGELECMTTRLLISQDYSYCIDIKDIANFIDSDINDSESTDKDNSTQPVGGNGPTNTGGNGPTNTGGNGPTNTGGNGPTNTEGNCGKGQIFDFFLEPSEGIPVLIDDAEVIVLAIGGNQIDGDDDYKTFINTGEVIKRDVDGYPEKDIRDQTIKNLSGVHIFNNSSKSTSLLDQNFTSGWNKVAKSDVGTTIITLTETELQIDIPLHVNMDITELLPPRVSPEHSKERQLKFAIETSSDSKTITLKTRNYSMTCENKNYLKLICDGERYSFSLSLDNIKKEGAHFRFLEKKNHEASYFYGVQ